MKYVSFTLFAVMVSAASAATIIPVNELLSLNHSTSGSSASTPTNSYSWSFTVTKPEINFIVTIKAEESANKIINLDTVSSRGIGAGGDQLNGGGGSNDELTFSINIGTINVTDPDYSLVSSTLSAAFTEFDLVNNGVSSPAVNYSSGSATGTLTSTNTSSGASVTQALTGGGSSLVITRVQFGSWLNNVDFTVTGDVEIVPEPSSISLLILGSLGLLARRRR